MEDYQYINDTALMRVDTGDSILIGNRRDARWLRVLEWVAEGNTIALAPDLSAKDVVRDTAREALRAVDWADKVSKLSAGRARLTDLQTQIIAINAATTLAQVKSPLVAALTDEALLLNGLMDEAEDNLRRWNKLLQVLAYIE